MDINMNGAGLLDMDEHDEDLLQHAAINGAIPVDPLNAVDPPKIRVVVRKRPINSKELEKGDEDVVDVDINRGSLCVNEPKQKVDLTKFTERHQFVFDDSLDDAITNDLVYSYTVQPLVHTIFKKDGKATCFAYGQTGSGKTYTMSPLPPRAASEILALLQMPDFTDRGLFVSCFEIYGNKVFDLLNARKKLEVREDAKRKVNIVGLKEWHVQDDHLVQQLIEHSAAARCTGQTGANAESSRSHSIMQFSLKKQQPTGEPGGREVGRLSFIDLAGSERGADTFDNDRQTRLEGAEINKSLLALKECIRALDGDARHVPFRGSKLTEVLRDSFIGEQARTVMIANISPSSASVEHTLNTLRYADRVKELRKEKGQRALGGVTPGGKNLAYNIAAVRGANNAGGNAARPSPPAANQVPPRTAAPPAPAPAPAPVNPARQPFVPRPVNGGDVPAAPQAGQPQNNNNNRHQAAADAAAKGGTDADLRGMGPGPDMESDAMMQQRHAILSQILEEEDELIQCHRKQIEDTMNIVRSEMNLLAEVDQPGSAIDSYVEKLGTILQRKKASIEELVAKLDSFKAKLREEELLSRTASQHRVK